MIRIILFFCTFFFSLIANSTNNITLKASLGVGSIQSSLPIKDGVLSYTENSSEVYFFKNEIDKLNIHSSTKTLDLAQSMLLMSHAHSLNYVYGCSITGKLVKHSITSQNKITTLEIDIPELSTVSECQITSDEQLLVLSGDSTKVNLYQLNNDVLTLISTVTLSYIQEWAEYNRLYLFDEHILVYSNETKLTYISLGNDKLIKGNALDITEQIDTLTIYDNKVVFIQKDKVTVTDTGFSSIASYQDENIVNDGESGDIEYISSITWLPNNQAIFMFGTNFRLVEFQQGKKSKIIHQLPNVYDGSNYHITIYNNDLYLSNGLNLLKIYPDFLEKNFSKVIIHQGVKAGFTDIQVVNEQLFISRYGEQAVSKVNLKTFEKDAIFTEYFSPDVSDSSCKLWFEDIAIYFTPFFNSSLGEYTNTKYRVFSQSTIKNLGFLTFETINPPNNCAQSPQQDWFAYIYRNGDIVFNTFADLIDETSFKTLNVSEYLTTPLLGETSMAIYDDFLFISAEDKLLIFENVNNEKLELLHSISFTEKNENQNSNELVVNEQHIYIKTQTSGVFTYQWSKEEVVLINETSFDSRVGSFIQVIDNYILTTQGVYRLNETSVPSSFVLWPDERIYMDIAVYKNLLFAIGFPGGLDIYENTSNQIFFEELFNINEDSAIEGTFDFSPVAVNYYDADLTDVMGSFVIDSDNYQYSPPENEFGTDIVKVTANTNEGNLSYNMTFEISSVNDAPIAEDHSLTLIQGNSLTLQVIATDIENDSLFFSLVNEPVNGSAEISDVGLLSYTAFSTFEGTEILQINVDDNNGGTDVATVTISVTKEHITEVTKEKSGGSLYWVIYLLLVTILKRNMSLFILSVIKKSKVSGYIIKF